MFTNNNTPVEETPFIFERRPTVKNLNQFDQSLKVTET